MRDIIHPRGFVTVRRFRGEELLSEETYENMVVDSGLTYLANRCSNSPTIALMSHMAIGTNGAAPGKTNAALWSELARVAFSTTPTQSGAQLAYSATFEAGIGTSTGIQELGIFNASSGGVMLARVAVPTQPKEATTKFEVQWLVALQ